MRELYDRKAKERQKVRKGNQPGATPANLPDLQRGDARDHVGKVVGVSGKTIDHATKPSCRHRMSVPFAGPVRK